MKELNVVGQKCPDPVNALRREVRSSKHGDEIKIITDDPASDRMIPGFCTFMGHELLIRPTPSSPQPHVFVVKVKQ